MLETQRRKQFEKQKQDMTRQGYLQAIDQKTMNKQKEKHDLKEETVRLE